MPTQRRLACKPRPPAIPAVNLTTAELMVLMTIPGTPVVRLLGRRAIEAAVERLIDHLDALDAPGEDMEPYLTGFTNGADDREGGDILDEPEGSDTDIEPSLGRPEDIEAQIDPRALYCEIDTEQDDADLEDDTEDDDPGAEPWWERPAHPDLTEGAYV